MLSEYNNDKENKDFNDIVKNIKNELYSYICEMNFIHIFVK